MQDDTSLEALQESVAVLRNTYAGVSMTFSGIPQQKTFTDEQKAAALKGFDASAKSTSMSKVLIDSDEPAVQAVLQVKRDMDALFTNTDYTRAYPRPGYRLIIRSKIPEFAQKVEELREQLARKAVALRAELPAIKLRQQAPERLGKLYNEEDYNFDPTERLGIVVTYPNLEVPSYLRDLDPETYQQELDRIRDEMYQAARLEQERLAEQMYRAVDHLAARLATDRENGKPQVFRDDTVDRIYSYLDETDARFKELKLPAGELRSAFDKLRKVMRETPRSLAAVSLRQSEELRREMSEKLSAAADALYATAVLQPRRLVLRPGQS